MSTLWALTFFGMVKFAFSFKEKVVEDKTFDNEVYNRLLTIF